MDADTVLELRPALSRYLAEFEPRMGKRTNRGRLETYVAGRPAALERESAEPIALATGTTLMGAAIGLFGETGFPKKGRETACVQRQYRGAVGKVENWVVSVHPTIPTGERGQMVIDEQVSSPDPNSQVPRRAFSRPGASKTASFCFGLSS